MGLLDQECAFAGTDFELEAFGWVFEPCAEIEAGGFRVVDDRIGEDGEFGLRDSDHPRGGVKFFSMAESK